ncbi:hypothetical protein LOZ58_003613, partial [Ophidiomyces ophidiicola]
LPNQSCGRASEGAPATVDWGGSSGVMEGVVTNTHSPPAQMTCMNRPRAETGRPSRSGSDASGATLAPAWQTTRRLGINDFVEAKFTGVLVYQSINAAVIGQAGRIRVAGVDGKVTVQRRREGEDNVGDPAVTWRPGSSGESRGARQVVACASSASHDNSRAGGGLSSLDELGSIG